MTYSLDISEAESAEANEPSESPTSTPVEPAASPESELVAGQRSFKAAKTTESLLAKMSENLDSLAADSKLYHARAEQREAVIDSLHAELERLRRGERKSILRPLLTEICRLRDDLLRQAQQLPDGFDEAMGTELLRGYAESIEIALADNGVTPYAPQPGDPFVPREHRGIGNQPTNDQAQVGAVATVRRGGYRDIESGSLLALAEVAVFVADDATEPSCAPEPTAANWNPPAVATPGISRPTPTPTRPL